MQPAYIEALDFLNKDSLESPNNNLEEINKQTIDSVEEINNYILQFKKNIFNQFVSNNMAHNAADLGAMTNYHALFLFWISYWISILDHNIIPKPQFNNSKNSLEFDSITELIKKVIKNPDAKVLVHHMLSKLSSEPFTLSKKTQSD
jgi:hypothetical protein